MSLLRWLGEQFVITLLCIGPVSILAGAFLILPFAFIFKVSSLDSLKKRKGIEKGIPGWLIDLCVYFPMGLVAFPLARLIFGLEVFGVDWNLRSYLIISSALAVFAILTAFGVATRAEKEDAEKMSVKTRMFVFLGAYAGGVLVGAFLK